MTVKFRHRKVSQKQWSATDKTVINNEITESVTTFKDKERNTVLENDK
jgi:hypothetical protein